MNNRPIKVGIIGTGRATSISKGHLRGFLMSGEAELIGVYDLSRDSAEQWCDAFGVDKTLCYDDPDQLIRDADAVSICTPNFTHADYICKCLAANTHVLCEKPISSTTADIPRIRQAMAASSAVGMVNLTYRYVPGYRLIHDLLSSGDLGAIYTIRHNMGGSRLANESIPLEWRFVRSISGTGALGDFGSHALDLLRYLVGEENGAMTQIHALQRTFIPQRMSKGELRPVENDDCTMITASLACGGLYNLLLSRTGSTPSTMEIVCARGIIQFCFDMPDRINIQRRPKGGAYGLVETVIAEDVRPEWHGANSESTPYLACEESAMQFIRTLRSGEIPATSLEYGISLLELVEQIDAISAGNREENTCS